MAIGSNSDQHISSDTDAHTTHIRKQFASFLGTELDNLHFDALATDLVNEPELCEAIRNHISSTTPNNNCQRTRLACHQTAINSDADGCNQLIKICVAIIICLLISSPVACLFEYVLGIRCILPNNYLIWEATRPISDCIYCTGVDRPLILNNMTQEDFQVQFYSQYHRTIVHTNLFTGNFFSLSPIRRGQS